jgi:hypothetical protein
MFCCQPLSRVVSFLKLRCPFYVCVSLRSGGIPTNFIDVGAFCKLIKKQRFSRFVTKAGWVCTAKGPKSTISILRLEARGRIE